MKKFIEPTVALVLGFFLFCSGCFQVTMWSGAGHGPSWPDKLFDPYLGMKTVYTEWLESLCPYLFVLLWITMLVCACARKFWPTRIMFAASLLWVSIMTISGVLRSGYMINGWNLIPSPFGLFLRFWTILIGVYLGWLWFLLLFRSKAQVYEHRRNPV